MAIKKHFYTKLGSSFWLLAAIFAVLPSWPHLYYRLSPQASQALASTIANTAKLKPSPSPAPAPVIPAKAGIHPDTPDSPSPKPLPEQDLSLPTENGLIIDSIGVRGQLQEGDDWQNLLKKGIWRVPNFASPESNTKSPIILAAHRWGYLEWSNSFRKLNSFYNLPKLKEGDKIELIWNQRKYEYKVESTSTGTEIGDYSHDLILYTCQLWNSPVRFFVYASRTN